MKVAQVCIAFYPEVSGATVCAEETAERLAGAGHESAIFTHDAGPPGRAFERYEVRRFRESALVRRLSTRGYFPQMVPGLKDFDIVHARNLWWSTILAIRGARRFGKKSVVTLHGGLDMLEWFGIRNLPVYKKFLFPALRSADRILALGEWEKKLLLDIGVRESAVSIVPNGVDGGLFRPAGNREELRGKWGIAKDDFAVLFVGFLHRRKGIDLLAEAIPRVAQARPGARFLFAGNSDTEDAKSLAAAVREKGAEKNARFLGVVPRAELPGLYSAADVFTLPSYCEGQPRVILEAMACGLPSVATRVQGTPDMALHEETGLLVEPGDAGGLAAALLRAAENPDDLKKWGVNARKMVEEKFDWGKIAARTLEIYGELLGEKSGL